MDVEDVLDVNERLLKKLFKEICNYDLQLPIQRMTWREEMCIRDRIYPVYNHPCSGISSRSGGVPDAEECGQLTADCGPVSYTHLDVYKRQD